MLKSERKTDSNADFALFFCAFLKNRYVEKKPAILFNMHKKLVRYYTSVKLAKTDAKR